jgi:hypothetical protein
MKRRDISITTGAAVRALQARFDTEMAAINLILDRIDERTSKLGGQAMSSLHLWLVALARGLKRDKHKRRIEEEARRDRLKLKAYREQMRAEALVEVERLGLMGGRPHEMRLGTYRRHEPPKRLEAPDGSHHHPIPDEPPFPPVLPMGFDPPAAPPDPPSFDPGGPDGSW